MATVGGSNSKINSSYDPSVNYTVPLVLMSTLFFMIGFITVLNDVLIPSLKEIFSLETWQAMLIQFCFFIAYFVMSVPSGEIIKKIGYKKGLTLALTVMGTGLFLFVPASMVIAHHVPFMVCYSFFLFALFVVGCGLSILQVAINPYIIALGPEATGASRLNLGGALNSTATFIGPIIGAAYILPHGITDKIAKAAAVQGPYFILACITIAIGLILYFIKLPKLQTEVASDEKIEGSAWDFNHLLYGAGAIFFYVGAEVAIGSLLVVYIKEEKLVQIGQGAIASLTDEKAASSLVAYYWGSAMIGRFIGSALGQKIKANVMLSVVSIIAILLIGLSISGIFDHNMMNMKVMVLTPDPFNLSFEPVVFPVSIFLLVLVGLFNSVMWPCIFPLSLNGLGKHTSQGSGILVSMVVGGALIPLLQGFLAKPNILGYQMSFLLTLACYAYIFFFAVKGYVNKNSEIGALDNSSLKSQKAVA